MELDRLIQDDPDHAAELLELGDAFLELDRAMRIVRVNRRQEALSRKPREETLGRPFAEVWPEVATPESRAWRELHRCLTERVPVQFQEYYAPLDLWTGVTAYPLRTGGVAVFFRDLSAMKRAEREQRLLASIVEDTDDAIVSKRLDGVILSWNAGAERLFGYTADEAVGRPISMLLPPDRLDEEERILAELRAGRRVHHFETTRVRKDGSRLEVSVSISPLRDDRGEIVGASKIARDIGDRRRALAALRGSEERFRSVVENLSEGLMLFDADGNLVYQNPASLRIHGFDPDDPGRIARERLPVTWKAWDDRGRPIGFDEWPVSRVFRGERFQNQVLRVERVETGQVFYASYNGSPILDADGALALGFITIRDVTEQRRAEDALRASEAQFRSVFEQAAIGMGRVRFSDARWIDVNEAFCRMLGRSREELLATPWPAITHPQDLDLDLVPFRRMAAGELDSYSVEKRFLHADGRHVWARLTLSAVRDGEGRPEYEIAIIEDVTAQRRAEAAVREAARAAEDERRRLATVLEALPAGVAIADAKGGFTHVNAEFRRIWGSPPSPRSAAEYGAWRGWWPDGRPIATAEWALPRALQTGEVIVPGDLVDIEKFDGSGRATIVNAAAPIRDAAGEIVGGVLAEVDITVQRRAEAAARAAEQRIRAVVEHLPAGLVVADLATGALHWNAEALRIHGYTGGEEHRFLDSLVRDYELQAPAGEPIPVPAWPLSRLLRGESFRDLELRVRNTRLGWDRVFSYSGVIVELGGGAALGLLAIGDVSARSRAEAALRGANERLREADRRKDEFLGMLSHELRNPLAPIRNALYVLDRVGAPGERAVRARDVAGRQLAHLTRLVDDLLDVTRVARGKIELRRSVLDLAALARRTAEDYGALMRERGLALAVEAPDGAVPVDGDETRLAQVLGNLLSNAAKFTPAGGRVTVSVRRSGAAARMQVRDTGVGIAPDLLPSIFDPFTQAKQTLARSDGGLGLGLALVKGLTELHGGRVSAHSAPGDGTEFTVELPLAPEADPARPADEAGPAPRGRRVLVVDDNVDAADSLADLVRILGHEVAVAYDGPSAIASAAERPPEVVLCDLGLPGMDGYEVAKALRAKLSGGVKLVAVSGYAQPEDVRRAAAAGFDEHIAKPPDPDRIERLFG